MTAASSESLWQGEMPEIRGPWLGGISPERAASEFCPTFLGGANRITGITFSPNGDEAFFSLNTLDGMSADLMWTRLIDGLWSTPEPAPFNSPQIDNDIVMSPDGQRLCWRSWRPLPGKAESEKGVSLWAADRTADGWGEPFPVECGGERQPAVYPGIATDGTLYFSVRVSEDEYCIAQTRRVGEQYGEREPIITGLTSSADLCVAPDESFLVATIFSQPRFKGIGNLHVSFQTPEGTWTSLQDLGLAVKTELTEYCPTLSADGRRLFFCRIEREDRSVPARTFWIETAFIEELRQVILAGRKEQY